MLRLLISFEVSQIRTASKSNFDSLAFDTMYYSRGSIYRVATQYTKSFKRVLISVSFRVQLLQLSSASRSIPPILVVLD